MTERLKKIIAYLKQPKLPKVTDGPRIFTKFRWVDPQFIERGWLISLTEADLNYAQDLEAARQKHDQGIIVPDIDDLPELV